MLISLRKRQSIDSNSQATIVQVMDQSFAESNISKRFARTKNNSNQHMKSGRQVKQHLTLHTNKSTSKQAQKEGKLLSNYIKTDDFFIKINQTPKNKPYFTPISSDRATESTNLKSRQQSDSMVFNSNTHGKETVAELKSQLQLKSAQLMFLQDEVMRLKRQLIWKQQQLIKLNIRKEKEYQAQLTRLKQQIKMLQQESVSKSNEIKQQKKIESGLNRQIKSLKYDKTVLEKHIEELYKMKLTKDLKELISFRELSLIKQIEELKARLSQNKSEAEVKMQEQIRRLKEENNEKIADLKKIQVHTRIMNRKMMENQNELKEKTQTFSKYYMSMKQSQNDLIDQLKKARKENIKLRRLHILSHSHLSKKLICQSSESSLNISLSSSN